MTDRARILLVGATGRVGRLLLASWRATPPDTAQITCQSRKAVDFPSLIWSPGDDIAPLQSDIDRHGPFAAMIMLAGVTPATGDDMGVNIRVAQAAIEAAAKTGIPRVLLASSSAIYGAGTGASFAETDLPAPTSDYARSKLAMEQTAAAYRSASLQICALRIGNVAGADALLLNAAHATDDAPIRIDCFADGTGPHRNYIGPATMALVLERLCLTPAALPDTLNLAAPRPVSMEALAAAASLPWTFNPAPDTAIHRVTLDCTRLSELYQFANKDSDPAEMIRQLRQAT